MAGAIARATPAFSGACEVCGTGRAGSYVVVDDLPMMMCSTCQQRLEAEGEMAARAYEMIEIRHLPGAVTALGAAVIGGLVWAAIGAITHRIFVIAAIGIGGLVALAYQRAAGRVDAAGRVIAGSFTLLSVMLGEVVLLSWWIGQEHPEIGFRLDVGWYAYVRIWAKDPGQEIVAMLFGLVGAWFATQALKKPKLVSKVESAGSTNGEPRKAA